MKKYVWFILALVVFACSRSDGDKSAPCRRCQARIKVLATVPMICDLVKMIAKDRVECTTLIGPGIDPHSYEIVTGDRNKIKCADLVVANGLMLEHGANLNRSMREHKNTLFLGDYFIQNYNDALIYIEGQVDPHIWMDAMLWSKSIDPIVERLIELDPEHKSEYEAHAQEAKEALAELDSYVSKKMQSIDEKKRYLITTHDAFFYFARRYLSLKESEDWNQRVKAPQGLNPQEEISFFQIDSLCSHILKHDLHHIFFESNLSKQSLKKIVEVCSSKGQKVLLCSDPLYGDTFDDKNGPVKNYADMMRHNADLISSVLSMEVKNDSSS